MDIQNSLQILGLSDKEAAIYAALLKMKKGTALSIAAAAGIKRPTAYSVLESLIAKKLVAVTKYRDVKDYRALPLEHLKSFVYRQRQISERELGAVQKLYNERQLKVRLRVYAGATAVKTLFEKSLREKSVMHILGSEEWLARHFGMYWQYFLKRTAQLNIPPQFKPHHSEVMLLLWSDKVAFVEKRDAGQVFGFKNRELYDLYKNLWNNY